MEPLEDSVFNENGGRNKRKRGPLARLFQKMVGNVEPKMWLVKFVPLLILQFASIFAYTMLKNTKNAVFIKVTDSTVFGFLKQIVIWPLAMLFPIIFSLVTKALRNKREKVPYVMLAAFIGFFTMFMFVLLPYGTAIQFPGLSKWLLSIPFIPPAIAKGLGDVLGYWDYSIFYGLSEMVAVVFINMFAWGVANEICSSDEGKTFYPLFAGMTAYASYAASTFMLKSKLSATSADQFVPTMQNILSKVVIALIIYFLSYLFIERFVMKNPEYVTRKEPKVKNKPQGAGFKMVWQNPYLRNIGMIVLSYSLLIFMLEQCWYESINTVNRAAYSSVLAKTTQVNAIMTFTMSLLAVWLGSFPWIVRAMLPVVMLGGGGLLAVGLFAFQNPTIASSVVMVSATAVGPMVFTVLIGCVGSVMCRSAKYTLFDSTKEELFRSSTDPDVRSGGKAVVDVVCGRVGKSGSSVMVTVLLALAPMFMNIGNRRPEEKLAKVDPLAQEKKEAKEILKKMFSVAEKEKHIEISLEYKNAKQELAERGYQVKESENGLQVIIPKKESKIEESKNQIKNTIIKETTTKRVINIKDISPAIFVIVMTIVIMWGYAVISIAPEYEKNIRETEGEAKARSPYLNLNNCLTLAGLATMICGITYFLLSKEISPILLGH